MATFLTPAQIEEQYFQILKSIKPSLNINDQNSDFVIRGKAFAGLTSGIYGDQSKVDNDTYVSVARPEALTLHGLDLGIEQQPATAAKSSQVRVTGTNGTVVNPGDITFLYSPTGILYTNINGGTISGGQLDLQIEAQSTGQIGNVKAPDTLQIVSPPSGVNASASIIQDITDGADIESTDSYRSRLLARLQHPPAGGNEFDYPQFAFDADPSVRSAYIKRFGRGLGTVDVYITSGTTDIDDAVTNGQPVLRIPSGITLGVVQSYYDSHAPLTDCPMVYAPNEVPIPVSVKVRLAQGLTLSSIPSNPTYNPLGLTVSALISREIARVLYKLPVGGRQIPSLPNGYVTASDIEEGLDVWLSAVKDSNTGSYIGKIPVLADRQVQALDSPNTNYELMSNELAAPDTVTITIGV